MAPTAVHFPSLCSQFVPKFWCCLTSCPCFVSYTAALIKGNLT
uniref:Uncharacterized protein n=1 Tax=Arundo donax TaxID=35708 RepID=A0A0A8YPD7_ARUDO